MADPVVAPSRESDPRDPDLQAQIEDIRGALEEWRRKREYSQATEQRLARITVQCARMVESWQQLEQRRTVALAGIVGGVELGPGENAPGETARDTGLGERLQALERTIEHEWEALPEGDERASLAESCVAAAELTLKGFARAEARLAALEQDMHARLDGLSRDLQAVVSELRTSRQPSLPGSAPAFSLESVMRIHEELRESDPDAPAEALNSAPGLEAVKPPAAEEPAPRPDPALALPQAPEATPALAARVESLERAVSTPAEVPAPTLGGWRPLYAALAVALVSVALFGLWMQRRVDARLTEAAARVADAERQSEATTAAARQEAAATREEAARQVSEAQQSAAQAQIVGNVLAAPDLLRYRLRAADATSRAYAQVLFSRSRGMVFSASRLAAAGAGRTYQLWLLTSGGPVSAGLLTPDAEGRVTLATDAALTTQGRVIGAFVSIEAAGGSPQPSPDRALIRVEPIAAAPTQ